MRQPILRSVQAALGRGGPFSAAPVSLPAACFRCSSLGRTQALSTAAMRAPTAGGGRRTRGAQAAGAATGAQQTRRYATPVADGTVGAEASELSAPLAAILQQMSAAGAPSHPSLYATVHIHGRPYLVTAGDRLRLPFRMADVQPGDTLRLDRVGVVGSRSVTAVGSMGGSGGGGPTGEGVQHGGHVPGVSVQAVVLGFETEPMRVLVKTKRRNRRKRTVHSKHQFTVLRIQEVVIDEEDA